MDRRQSYTAFGHFRQPARSLVIDLSPPLSQSVCKLICSGLENLLTMVCSLSGQSRLPSLSITTLGTFPEILLPLQHVRGNFSRLQCAVEEIKRVFVNVQSSREGSVTEACLHQALQDICEQFKRQTKTMMQTNGQWYQLDIVVLTSQNCTKLSRQLEKMMASVALENLRRIQVVTVQEDFLGMEDVPESAGSQKSSTSETSSETGVLGILVDTLQIECDSLSIQNYFNSWLRDVATDREHLHIILPPLCPGSEELVVRCDLQERMVNPDLLPGLSLSLKTDRVTLQSKAASLGGEKPSQELPIYYVRIEKMLPASALCESIVFGMPLVIQPTSCWKIDWEDLEQNQQDFQSLCEILTDKDMVLIGSAIMPRQSQGQKAVYKSSLTDGETLTAWFVILPVRSSMLIKSVGVNELMLPCSDNFHADKPNEGSRDRLIGSLEQLETIGVYNPLVTRSGLYDVLRAQYRKPVTERQPRKRLSNKTKQEQDPAQPSDTAKRMTKPGASVTFKRFCPPGSLGLSRPSFPTEL